MDLGPPGDPFLSGRSDPGECDRSPLRPRVHRRLDRGSAPQRERHPRGERVAAAVGVTWLAGSRGGLPPPRTLAPVAAPGVALGGDQPARPIAQPGRRLALDWIVLAVDERVEPRLGVLERRAGAR